ncbi:MAG TPA: hypothetical protein DCK98_13040 [Chloroflexi bacterium]|nr:hypothetical protein [Chloroflexota bacterium]HAL26134.1 hypothetical protein [Chloroflexota bacterium]
MRSSRACRRSSCARARTRRRSAALRQARARHDAEAADRPAPAGRHDAALARDRRGTAQGGHGPGQVHRRAGRSSRRRAERPAAGRIVARARILVHRSCRRAAVRRDVCRPRAAGHHHEGRRGLDRRDQWRGRRRHRGLRGAPADRGRGHGPRRRGPRLHQGHRHDARPGHVTVLSGARVVVTGGAGNVGSHIVDAAIAAGAREVVALDALVRGVPANLAMALSTGKARLDRLDIRDRAAVAATIDGADVVFHQAALRWTRCQEAPRECHEVMVDGTFNVLEAAAAAKAKHVVLASSAVVYGEPEALPMHEDQPLNGTTFYGSMKVANEQLARAFASLHGLPTTTLRYFNVYGPRMDVRSRFVEVMIRWLNLIDTGKPLTLFGDGSSSVDFVYVGDVVRANLLACAAGRPAAIVNVCSGVETKMRDLAALLLRLTGSSVGMEFKPQPRAALPARRVGDPARATELLGFKAETSLEDGVRKLIEWRKEVLKHGS